MSRRLTPIFLILLLPLYAHAVGPSPEELANEARGCRERSQEALAAYDNLVGSSTYHGEFTRQDLKLAKPAFDAQSHAWLDTAAAYEKGDVAAAKELRQKADAAANAVNRWRDRLDARAHESDVGPREGSYDDAEFHTPPAARPALVALFDAQSDAADAWCRLAEATTPDADADHLADLRDAALAASDEVELAHAAWDADSRRERFAAEKGASAAAVRNAIEKLRQTDEQRLAAKRQQLEQARRVRQLERQSAKLEADVLKQLDAARGNKR